jgi:hypothetical protein
MNAREQRVLRLEKAANISSIDVAAMMLERLAARRRSDWREPSPEERLARWRAMREQPMEPEAAELVERFINASERA